MPSAVRVIDRIQDQADYGSALIWASAHTFAASLLIGSGTMSVGTSGVGVLVIGNGTVPTTQPVDEVQLFSADYAAGDARLLVWTEQGRGLWIGNQAIEARAPTSGAGLSLTLKASAAISGNTNGGSITITPGAKFGTGVDGTVVVKAATASPGANLQEWQTSAGAVLTRISKEGWLETPQGKLWPNGGSGTAAEFLTSMIGGIYFTADYPNDSAIVQFSVRGASFKTTLTAPGGATTRYSLHYGTYSGWLEMHSGGEFRVSGAAGRQVVVVAGGAATTGLVVRGAASQTANLQEWQTSAGAVLGTISENGYWTTRKNAAPADAELAAGEVALWFDSTNGAAKLMIKGKSADGTVVSGSVALA